MESIFDCFIFQNRAGNAPLFCFLCQANLAAITLSQIEHSRHRSVQNFLTNIVAALIAYTHQKKKPSLNFSEKEIDLLSKEFQPEKATALLVF